jgi:DNA polymerase-4
MGTFDKVIFHIDLDAFFASVEQQLHPELRGQPVIVKGPGEHRTVVSAASYEARPYGIKAGMPVTRARKLCPHGRFVSGSAGVYAHFSEKVFDICHEFTPLIEPASIDEGYLDLAGTERLYRKDDNPSFWPVIPAEALKLTVKKRLGLNCSIGIASNKLIAKIASQYAKPNGIACVLPGAEKAFLKPLDVNALPGIGPKSLQVFQPLGINTIGDLQKMPINLLKGLFGVVGEDFYYLAQGLGSDTIDPPAEPKSVSRGRTFEKDHWDVNVVKKALRELVADVCRQLRTLGYYAKLVTIRIRYPDFTTFSRSGPMGHYSNHDHDIHSRACELLDELYHRRQPIRLICVGVSQLAARPDRQLTFWDKDSFSKHQRIYHTVDKIRSRYGDGAISFRAGYNDPLFMKTPMARLQPVRPKSP